MKTLIQVTLVVSVINLGACATKVVRTNTEALSAISTGEKGGFTFNVATIPSKPCDNFEVSFSDATSGAIVGGESLHGFINLGQPTEIIGAKPGNYLPFRGRCVSIEHSGNYKNTYDNTFKIDATGMKPIIVLPGKVTVINSLKFRLISRNLASVSVEASESAKIKKIKSKNAQFIFVEN